MSILDILVASIIQKRKKNNSIRNSTHEGVIKRARNTISNGNSIPTFPPTCLQGQHKQIIVTIRNGEKKVALLYTKPDKRQQLIIIKKKIAVKKRNLKKTKRRKISIFFFWSQLIADRCHSKAINKKNVESELSSSWTKEVWVVAREINSLRSKKWL